MGFFDFLKPKPAKTAPKTESVKLSPFASERQSQASGGEVPTIPNTPSTKWWQQGEATSYRSGQPMETFVFPAEDSTKGRPPEINVGGSYNPDQSLTDEHGIVKPERRGRLFRRRISPSELLNSNRGGGEKKG